MENVGDFLVSEACVCMCMYVYIYAYIYVYAIYTYMHSVFLCFAYEKKGPINSSQFLFCFI